MKTTQTIIYTLILIYFFKYMLNIDCHHAINQHSHAFSTDVELSASVQDAESKFV